MKLIMCKGLPASGKTTFAKQYVLDNPSSVRVNKDELRQMVHAGKWSKQNEQTIIAYRDKIVGTALSEGKTIIVDDTNLAPKHEETLRRLASTHNADFEVKDFTGVSVEECIARDQKRANYVGEAVIKKMYKQFLNPTQARGVPLIPNGDPSLPQCVVFDLDGTIACIGDRSPYDGKKCDGDFPNWSVIALNKWISSDVSIIIFSGRSDDARAETLDWLDRFGVNFNELYMRKAGDIRKDAIVKEEMFNDYIKDKYQVVFTVDDRNQVVELWRKLGITCLQCAPGDF